MGEKVDSVELTADTDGMESDGYSPNRQPHKAPRICPEHGEIETHNVPVLPLMMILNNSVICHAMVTITRPNYKREQTSQE